MRKNILLIILLTALMPMSAFTQTRSVQKYTISGTVIDSLTGKPVLGIYVTTERQGAQTDKDGYFEIRNVPAGKTRLMTMDNFNYRMSTVDLDVKGNIYDVLIQVRQEVLMMDEVVVTGTRSIKKLADVPVLTTVITQRDIQKSGTTSLLEALQDNVPGIVFSPNGMGNNMRIKGLNSRYVLFLVDGERLVSEGAGGNVNLDQIDADNIKRIEMINGAASALYGSNAVGAVINVITKEPVHDIEAGANVSYESHNTWRAKADVGSSLKKFDIRASGFRNSSDGFGEDGGAYAAKYEDYGANLKVGYKPIERMSINAAGRYFQHETFNPEGSMNVTHAFTQNISGVLNGTFISRNGRNSMRLSGNYDKFFDFDILEMKNNQQKKTNSVDMVSARFLDTYTHSDKLEFVGGLEYNYEKVFSEKSLGVIPTEKSISDYNIFAQGEYEPVKDFDIVLGARYTQNSQFGGAFSPKLSLMYETAGFKFRGGVGTAFRAPSIRELYYDFDHQGMFWVYGNPDLKAEKGFYSSLSAEYTYKLFNMSVTGYYNMIGNKITQYDVVNSAGANEKYYKNVSSAALSGVDVSVSYVLVKQILLRASYSFCNAVDDATGLQLDSNVKHSGTVSATWNGNIARSPFSLQFAGRFNSPKLYQSVETDAAGNETVTLKQSKAYSVWKAVLVKPFRIRKHTLEATFKVDNIFNFKEVSFVNPGRQYLVGLRYRFK